MSEDLIPSAAPTDPAPAPEAPDEFGAIKEKYGNDINNLAKAFKGVQSMADQTAQKYRVPDEYAVKDEFKSVGETNLASLVETAKKGEYTQSQFDALVESVNGYQVDAVAKQAELDEKRKEAIGGEAEKLRDFYTGKLPEALLEEVLASGTPEQLKALKEHRNVSLVAKPTPTPGASMSDPVINPQDLISQKRLELVNVAINMQKGSVEEQQVGRNKQVQLANEICKLKESI
jgi:hypothetical protein